jgi:hypothetical protein
MSSAAVAGNGQPRIAQVQALQSACRNIIEWKSGISLIENVPAADAQLVFVAQLKAELENCRRDFSRGSI